MMHQPSSESKAAPFSKYAALAATKTEVSDQNFKKSYAQVASSVSPPGSPSGSPSVVPNSFARLRPIPQRKRQSYGIKLKDGELEIIKGKAAALGMSLNAYCRAKALGDDYIEKPPEWLRDALLKLYVELVREGNNLNQIARQVNSHHTTAEAALAIVEQHRQPMFRALEKLELALSGRKPPEHY